MNIDISVSGLLGPPCAGLYHSVSKS